MTLEEEGARFQRIERVLHPVVVGESAQSPVGAPVETKLHAPVPRKEWVERHELVDYLTGVKVRFVLIQAPAGFGKTTLVAQWRSSAAESRAFAWVWLDRGDSDPARLWLHVVSALQRVCPGFDGDSIVGALQAQAADIMGAVLPTLMNELAGLVAPVVLVLDDFGVIKDRSCLDQLRFFVLRLPVQVVVVVVTRSDPALPVARLRAANDLAEIGMTQLRFMPTETAELVRKVSAHELSEAELRELTECTEGWPAAVYLAALSLRENPARGVLTGRLTGTKQKVADLLAAEVLSYQPGHIRKFLQRTAILRRFNAPVCDAVTGSDDAAEIIDILQQENLFVIPLDDDRQWFRYHHLFSQTLRSELIRSEPKIISVLHKRASEWHQIYGSVDEAVDHALAAGDSTTALALIKRHWFGHVVVGRLATVRAWLRAIGDREIARDPVAAHCAMWVAATAGDPELVQRWLPVVDAAGFEHRLPDGMRSLRSSAALIRGTFGFESIWEMLKSAAMAVDLEDDPASVWYDVTRTVFGAALYYSGEFAAAVESLEEVLRVTARYRLYASALLSLATIENGQLAQAERLAHAAYQVAADPRFSLAPMSGYAYAATGAVFAAQGELARARSEFEHAQRLFHGRHPIGQWPKVDVALRLAAVLFDLGDHQGAAALIDESKGVLTSLPEGAGSLVARLRQLERRLAGRPHSKALLLADQLTAREEAVLSMLGGRLSLREIGQQMGVSVNTVKAHTRAIYRKLGVSTRHDAVVRARQAGLV